MEGAEGEVVMVLVLRHRIGHVHIEIFVAQETHGLFNLLKRHLRVFGNAASTHQGLRLVVADVFKQHMPHLKHGIFLGRQTAPWQNGGQVGAVVAQHHAAQTVELRTMGSGNGRSAVDGGVDGRRTEIHRGKLFQNGTQAKVAVGHVLLIFLATHQADRLLQNVLNGRELRCVVKFFLHR